MNLKNPENDTICVTDLDSNNQVEIIAGQEKSEKVAFEIAFAEWAGSIFMDAGSHCKDELDDLIANYEWRSSADPEDWLIKWFLANCKLLRSSLDVPKLRKSVEKIESKVEEDYPYSFAPLFDCSMEYPVSSSDFFSIDYDFWITYFFYQMLSKHISENFIRQS